MAACGRNFTVVVTEPGDIWAWGRGRAGQLGLNTSENQLLPARVNTTYRCMVMVAAGCHHAVGVTSEGTLLSWGAGAGGQLGHGDLETRSRPTLLGKELFGGRKAVMVACGSFHTLVLTAGGLWTCGAGQHGGLGHGDEADKLVLTCVGAVEFRGAHIVMVAAGGHHSVTLGIDGRVWTWGFGDSGQLGHNNRENRLVPTRAAVVLVAAGGEHTVAVTIKGELWVCGHGGFGQLGLGDRVNRLAPTLVGAEAVFGGSEVLTIACGGAHSLAVTKDGTLWTFGEGEYGELGHNDRKDRLVPTRIDTQHFGNGNIV
eukprot:CAMPEP_0179452312 /NCGR_PEP_ID=MMETSP0799-20121207/36202_1 /TAXON_ID=46947 /ORGANISM="Geminigera cryophila, Strain CCMP2564" /LENGTH=313 /DNA_ID=CAMNT_0021248117 /DNA_START=33 /DNA_END=970 /DNA_ORIENTATION=+